MPASVATHGLLRLYVISSSTYNSDHKGPLKTCWCLLGSFRIIQFINNSAYTSYVFRIPFALLCLLWVYLHENWLFGYLSFESYCLFFPPSQSHWAFHARLISTAKERLSNCNEGHNMGTDKLLRKHCNLIEICGVSNSLLVIEDSELAIWSAT